VREEILLVPSFCARRYDEIEARRSSNIKAPGRGLVLLRIGAGAAALMFLFDLFFFCFDTASLFVSIETCIGNGCNASE